MRREWLRADFRHERAVLFDPVMPLLDVIIGVQGVFEYVVLRGLARALSRATIIHRISSIQYFLKPGFFIVFPGFVGVFFNPDPLFVHHAQGGQ